MKPSYILVILLTILLIYFLLRNLSKETTLPVEEIEKLPEEYETYQNLKFGVDTELHKIEPLFKNDFEEIMIAYFNNNDNSVFVKTKNYSANLIKSPDILLNNYYKLNTDGEIIDSLILAKREICKAYEGYLVNDHTYCTWLLNGDKTKHPIEFINRDLALSEEEVQEELKSLHGRATLAKNHQAIFDNIPYSNVIFLIDDKWVMLFADGLLGYSKNEAFPQKHIQRTFIQNLIDKSDVWNKKSNYLNLVHFQKKSFREKRKVSPFNPNSQVSYSKWEGEGYMHLNFKNDTIPLKLDLNRRLGDAPYHYEIPYRGSIFYFTTDELNYGLLANNYLSRLFLVKRK